MAKSRQIKAKKALRRLTWKPSKPSSSQMPASSWITDPNDILVLVMGPTGSGKSTFINTAADQERTTVGHDLQSCTAEIMPVRVTYPANPKARVVFIDTPGFDDSDVSDITILERVSEWLINTYANGVKLAGIIYLHEITQARMRGSFRKNYEMFGELCGRKAMANVVAVSTKWDQIGETEAEAREEQLKKFWATKLGNGFVAARFMHTYQSAWDIVDLLVNKERLEALQIQEELVDLEKALPDTAAGTTLQKQLQDALKEYEKTVQQKRSAAAMQKGPHEHTPNREDAKKRYEAAEERLREAEQKLQAVLDQIQQLKIPISTRIMRFFGLG